MKANDAFLSSLNMTDHCMLTYLKDLSEPELFLRPGKGCNHLAWQLGHLIQSEQLLLNQIRPNSGIELPAGFKEMHSKENVSIDDPSKFCKRDVYVDLYKKSRQNVKSMLSQMTAEDFDKPNPKGSDQFPTVGSLLNLIVNHPMMHVGQFVVVRRSLGKPVVI